MTVPERESKNFKNLDKEKAEKHLSIAIIRLRTV